MSNSLWQKSVLRGSTGPIFCTRLRPMAMGTTRDDGSQQLGAAGFDAFLEKLCARRSMRGWGGRVWRRGVISGCC